MKQFHPEREPSSGVCTANSAGTVEQCPGVGSRRNSLNDGSARPGRPCEDIVSPPSMSGSEDEMTLHTVDAFHLFCGRAADARSKVSMIPGGLRYAAAMKSIWRASAQDNPYADWLLIRAEAGLDEVRSQVAARHRDCLAELEALSRRGMSLSILASRNPRSVRLSFGSPYGYTMAAALLEFDQYVRVIKTLTQKGRIGERQGEGEIRDMVRRYRRVFAEPLPWEGSMSRGALSELRRSDFAPGADAPAQRRVREAVEILGEIPISVVDRSRVPRHGRRPERSGAREGWFVPVDERRPVGEPINETSDGRMFPVEHAASPMD